MAGLQLAAEGVYSEPVVSERRGCDGSMAGDRVSWLVESGAGCACSGLGGVGG